ncbi:membrane protein [Streptomyces mashuensis]|uniref:Membrane protein n=1 Tax=Streptomyces mashuensis TaxID=33904 RepID=A0A919EC45_9ACTN|nr:FxsA family membrane protein [Streptomyces mashuensis]GHF38034.1 membrane protein [Streptomyces mashuensis]
MTTGDQQQTTAGRPQRRGRARSLLPLGVAAWVVLEIWLLTLVADAAGGFTVLLLLVAGVVAGSVVIKRAGRRAWERLTRSLQSPGAEQPDGGGGNALTMLGGLLLMVPGLLSDAAGLLCLFPPTRALLRRTLGRRLKRTAGLGDAFRQARMQYPDGKVVQGEVIREDGPAGPRPEAHRQQLPPR